MVAWSRIPSCGGSLENLLLGHLSDLGLQCRVTVGEHTRYPVINIRLIVVEGRDQDFRCWQADIEQLAFEPQVFRLDLAHVDPGDDISVRHKQQPVTEKRTQHPLVDFRRNYFLNCIADRFQPGKRLNFIDNCYRVRNDRGCGMQQVGNLGAQFMVRLL